MQKQRRTDTQTDTNTRTNTKTHRHRDTPIQKHKDIKKSSCAYEFCSKTEAEYRKPISLRLRTAESEPRNLMRAPSHASECPEAKGR
eukprot:5062499-Pyramimonas_sp.AAC.1